MQTTPLLAGLGVAAAAYGSRAAMQAWQAFKVAPPRLRQFYKVPAEIAGIPSRPQMH